MPLNKSTGNMYDFVTHTFNTVKGSCPHDCSYCYMKAINRRFNKPQCAPYFDEKEMRTNLGGGNFIFVGSSNDLFAAGIQYEWITKTLDHCNKYDNKYLFQTKNPDRLDLLEHYTMEYVVATTLETDRYYKQFMGNAPSPYMRYMALKSLKNVMITIEPIMDFDLGFFYAMIRDIKPFQVNIGADTGRNNLPEPSKEKVLQLIEGLEQFTTVKQKSNLKRILNTN